MAHEYIDIHHHTFPPAYEDFLAQQDRRPGGWPPTSWSVDIDEDFCQSSNISTAILSWIPGGPSLEKDPDQARSFTRLCNEWNAALRDKSPEKYGVFAGVSNLAFTETSLDEIRYAFEVLKVDGIILATRYVRDNVSYYLGHDSLVPIWDELNARKAVVFVHPVPSGDSTRVNKNLPPPAYDFPHETGRAAIDMITGPANMLEEHAYECKIILSHTGGDLPYLIDRTATLLTAGPEGVRLRGKTKSRILDLARSFYYDTALSSSAMHLAALFALLGADRADHVLFGTNFPPGGVEAITQFTAQLGPHVDVISLRSNALGLFPRLQNKMVEK